MSASYWGIHEEGHSAEYGKNGKREYTIVYVVKVTSLTDGPAAVLAVSGLPIPGISTYATSSEGDAQAICESLTPSRKDHVHWYVTAKFATAPADDKKRDEDGKPEDDPFKWADQIELSGATFTRPIDRATYRSGLKGTAAGNRKAGKVEAPRNSAGVIFVPPAERDDTRLVLRITKFRKDFPTKVWVDYRDAINSDVFTIGKKKQGFNKTFEKYQCKLQPITGAIKYEGDVRYWEITYEIHAVDYESTGGQGWRFHFLDQGFHASAREGDDDGHGGTISSSQVIDGQPRVRRLVDRDGQPTTEPVLLDGDGNVLSEDSEAVYLEYSVYNEKPFAALGL